MAVEALPLLIDDDEKIGDLIYTERSRSKGSRPQSWAVPIMTHGLVALLVLLAVVFSPLAGFIPHHKLLNVNARPSLYCRFEDGL